MAGWEGSAWACGDIGEVLLETVHLGNLCEE